MNKPLILALLTLSAAGAFAQDEQVTHPSKASRDYAAYRAQSTDPLRGVARVKLLIKKIKSDKEENRYLPDKAYKSLSFDEKFAYCMLHGEDFSQNCNAMPQIMDEQTKIFPYFPGPFDDEAVWSDRQRDFLKNNHAKVIKMLRETINARHRVGNNLKQAIYELKITELIPDVLAVYKRDKKDRDILTLCMMMMEDAKYGPFLATTVRKKFYGDDSNYQESLPFTVGIQNEIVSLATSFSKTRTK